MTAALPTGPAPIHVLVGILTDTAGRVLIAERPAGRHMAGAWEFPGGKCKALESPAEALARELREELDIEVARAEPFMELLHDYPDRQVRLDVWRVHEYRGAVRAREGQALRWVAVEALREQPILAADAPIVEAILAGSTEARQ